MTYTGALMSSTITLPLPHRPCVSLGYHPAGSPEWHALRQRGLGGSEMAAVCRRHPYMTRARLLERKLTYDDGGGVGPAAEFGVWLEPFILESIGGCSTESLGTLQSTDHPFLLANLDGLSADFSSKECRGIEIKTCSERSRRHWRDGVPLHYAIQVQHYMAITKLEVFDVVSLVSPGERAELLAERDELADDDARDDFARELVAKSEIMRFEVEAHRGWADRMLELGIDFWGEVERGRAEAYSGE